MQETFKDVIKTLKDEGVLNREVIKTSLSSLSLDSVDRYKPILDTINNNIIDQNSILNATIKRIRDEGTLLRNSGTNSIKSLNSNILSIKKIFETIVISETLSSIDDSIKKQNEVLKETLENQKRFSELSSVNRTVVPSALPVPQAAASPTSAVQPRGGAGGLLASVGGAIGGAGTAALGLGIRGLAAGVSAFAAPPVLIGGTALVAFLAGLSGVVWLFGEGAIRVGRGINGVAEGMENLSRVGRNLQIENLVTAGRGLKEFLEQIGNSSSLFGAAVLLLTRDLSRISTGIDSLNNLEVNSAKLREVGTGLGDFLTQVGGIRSAAGAAVLFLTGDLSRIAAGIDDINKVEVNPAKLREAGSSLAAFFSGLGQASFWDRFFGAAATSLLPDLRGIAAGIGALSDTSKNIDASKFNEMSGALGNIAGPLARFAAGGIAANLVGSNALSDFANGISALNTTQYDRLEGVSRGIASIDRRALQALLGAGIAANFVGKGAFIDLSEGISALNDTRVDRAREVSDGIKILQENVFGLITSGFAANFVGKNAIIDLADGASHLLDKLGSRERVEMAVGASVSMNALSGSLLRFTGSNLVATLGGVATSIAGFFSETPFDNIIKLAEKSEDLKRGAEALESVAKSLETFSNIRLARSRIDFTSLAIDLGTAIPLLRGLAEGGVVTGITNRPLDFEGGLLNSNLRLGEMGSVVSDLSNAFAAFASVEMPAPRQRLDMTTLAQNLSSSIPILRGLSEGGVVGRGLFGRSGVDFGTGIFDPNLRIAEVAERIQLARRALMLGAREEMTMRGAEVLVNRVGGAGGQDSMGPNVSLPSDFGESIIGITSGILNSLERIESNAMSGNRNIILNNAPVIAPNVQTNQRGGTQVNQIAGVNGQRGTNWLDQYSMPNGIW